MKPRNLVPLLAAIALPACGPPTCPPVPVTRPPEDVEVPWTREEKPRVEAELAGMAVQTLLDTGFPQSVLALGAAGGVELSRVPVRLGGAEAGPLPFGLLIAPGLETAAVLGGDVLQALPLVFDARARTTRLFSAFAPPTGTAAPLSLWVTGRCRDDRPAAGPEGPHAFLVDAVLDGQQLRLAVDTGADVTFVRSSVVEALAERPRLEGARVATGFAGPLVMTATRARSLAVGSATSAGSLLLTAPEVDVELDRLLARYGGARCAGGTGCPDRIDGFLGWSFLREFSVGLSEGEAPTRGRGLTLERLSTQEHWKREFIGIGVYTAPSTDPVGERIQAFLSVSPAREAGLQEGDVLLSVDGVPAADAPSPYAAPGSAVTVAYARNGVRAPEPVTVTVQDLLPDPP